MSEILISTTDVEDIIHSLDINKAVGIDQISHRLIKGTKYTISEPLCMLFNKSLFDQTLPRRWIYRLLFYSRFSFQSFR